MKKRLLTLPLYVSLLHLLTIGHGALVQLDESSAASLCSSSSNPCSFSASNIWVGGTAPANGDDVSMVLVGSVPIYINLGAAISLNNVYASGQLTFSIDTSFSISANDLYVSNMTRVIITDANLQVQTATFTSGAFLQLTGSANLTVDTFTETGGHVLLWDTSVLQGNIITLDDINTNETTYFIGTNVTLLQGEVTIFCPVNISIFTVEGFPTLFGGYLGDVTLLANANLYIDNQITVQQLTLGSNSVFFASGSILFEGPINGAGSLYFMNSDVVIGLNDTQTDLRSVAVTFSGVTSATFYNVEFGRVYTEPSGEIPPQVTLYLYGVTFSFSTSFMCDIYASDISFNVEVNITGTLNSTGSLGIVDGGKLNVTTLVHSGGSVTILAPIISPSVSLTNTSLYLGAAIYGTTNLTTTQILASQPISFYGSISLTSCEFLIPQTLEVYVSGDIYSYGVSTLSGAITANSYSMYNGEVSLQGSLSAMTAVFRNSLLSIQNRTTLNCPGTLLEATIVSVLSPLTINGNLILHSFELASTSNQTVFVNGSVYSTGNSSVISTLNVIAATFTHVGSFFGIEGTITAATIGFADADITISGPTTLAGNVSTVNSVLGVHSPLVVQGNFLLRGDLQAPTPQTVVVTESVISGDNTFIYNNIHISTSAYYQNKGTLHLSGALTANSIVIAKGAILATKEPTIIQGNVHVQGGLLEFHVSTNITGTLTLDTTSQTMLYNNAPTNPPQVRVDGDVKLDGSLVYWISPAPKLGQSLKYQVLTYSNQLSGRFTTYDSYAPNIRMIKFDLKYGEHEITLEYHLSHGLGVGAVIGIVLSCVAVVLFVVVGVFFYRKYHPRQDYTSIEKIEEEIDKYLLSNSPQNTSTNSQ